MDAADLRNFARRDWELIAQSKEDCWLQQKAAMTPSEAIAMAAELNRYAHSIKPDWPNDEERAADLAAHVRLAELFLHAATDRSGYWLPPIGMKKMAIVLPPLVSLERRHHRHEASNAYNRVFSSASGRDTNGHPRD